MYSAFLSKVVAALAAVLSQRSTSVITHGRTTICFDQATDTQLAAGSSLTTFVLHRRLPWQLQLSLLEFSFTRLSVTMTTTSTGQAGTLRVTPRVLSTKPRATQRERGRRPRATSRVLSTHKSDSRCVLTS